jgi:hypothetical protein
MDEQLTDAQEQMMLDFWNKTPSQPPSISEIGKQIFGHEVDGRSKEGRAIKRALAKHSLRAKPTSEYVPSAIELSEAHQSYIKNNAATMNALEMARILFSNPNLTNLNAETRAVNEFIKTLDTRVVLNNGADTFDIPSGKDYDSPDTFDKALKRVNHYVNLGFKKEKLTLAQKKGLEMLIVYLHNFRFIKQINSYESESERQSFEDAFIRYTYDKPDLSQEEVDQYIVLANEVIISFKAQRRSERLQAALENITGNSAEDAKIAMSLVEAIGKAQNEFHQCINRQEKLLEALKEKRSSRLSKQIKENASILNLVQEWKYEEKRKEYLENAEKETKSLEKEVEKLSSLDELKARIMGLTKDEVINA